MGTQESEILPKKFTRNIFKLALHFFHFCEYKLISKISPKYWEHEKFIFGLYNWHITNFTRMPLEPWYCWKLELKWHSCSVGFDDHTGWSLEGWGLHWVGPPPKFQTHSLQWRVSSLHTTKCLEILVNAEKVLRILDPRIKFRRSSGF